MKPWEKWARGAVALLAALAFLTTAVYSFWPGARDYLPPEWQYGFFNETNDQAVRDLSVLFLTYAFIAASRQSDKDFYVALSGVLVSFALWIAGLAGCSFASTAGLMVAVASLFVSEVFAADKVWIWTRIPRHP